MPDINNIISGSLGMTAIILIGSLIFTVVIIFFVFRYVRKVSGTSADHQKILLNGVPGQARILAVQPTGTRVNYQPVADIMLEVHPQGGTPYHAQVRRMISQFQMMQFQVGAVVPVRIDQTDPSKVVIAL
ncbi:hypothetical protein FBR02_19490 [Anaerolineae bacterium CFX9]|nr:hypothetical protein [Oscillatoria laete-virens]MDL1902938.1 hypothetical protein [Anaerolineae bacterium CFX9]MDL5053825.1 hypothetical protein [Oscillatoria laete-virens NRMC-F 0139]